MAITSDTDEMYTASSSSPSIPHRSPDMRTSSSGRWTLARFMARSTRASTVRSKNLPYVCSACVTKTCTISLLPFRSLLQEDMHLVTANSKQFNPPGSIYYTEAERIESWASDQITKAAVSVIEYETDWKLDVDGEEEEEEMDVDEPEAAPHLSQDTVASPVATTAADDELRALHAAAIASGRRPPQRAAVKKIEMERAKELEKEKEKEKLGEKPPDNGLDEDGHMPGYKYGIGVFPPESGWSEVMIALKFRGVFLLAPFSCLPSHGHRQALQNEEGASSH
jgi:hypothetical protein